MAKTGKKTKKRSTLKRKVFILTILLFILFGLSAVAYTSYQYNKAREATLEEIKKNKGIQPNKENIEFNGDEEILDFVHVLLVGVDNEDGGPARTDTIMVAQYQPKTGKIKLLSLMRDNYVSIPGYRNNKINTAFFLGGPELLRQTLKENFDLDIHYFASVDFNGFIKVVDMISPDGVEIDIERRMYYQDTAAGLLIDFEPGLQQIDGKQALQYVRFRNDKESDFGRVHRQQQVLSILKDDFLTFSGVTKLPQLLGSIEPYIQTNIESKKILDYGRNFFLNPIENVETLTIPVEGSFENSRYSHAGAVLELDIEKNKQAIRQFFELDLLENKQSPENVEFDSTES